MSDDDPEYNTVCNYDEWTDDEGRSIDHPYVEADPEQWVGILNHNRFFDSISQFDRLMCDYEYPIEVHVGEDSMYDVTAKEKALPDKLNFYIAEDRQQFEDDVNHPLFRELGTKEFVVPKNANIGLAFGKDAYIDVIDIPEEFEYLDIKAPTWYSHRERTLECLYFRKLFE